MYCFTPLQVKEYRTPRTIRAFCKVVVFILPTLLSPWFAFIATKGAMDLHPFRASPMLAPPARFTFGKQPPPSNQMSTRLT
jgi:hypothetical protein